MLRSNQTTYILRLEIKIEKIQKLKALFHVLPTQHVTCIKCISCLCRLAMSLEMVWLLLKAERTRPRKAGTACPPHSLFLAGQSQYLAFFPRQFNPSPALLHETVSAHLYSGSQAPHLATVGLCAHRSCPQLLAPQCPSFSFPPPYRTLSNSLFYLCLS